MKACVGTKIKIIYLSTNYIYPGKKGNYKETDPLLPWNNYGWSKLGGESAIQMYKNSLILRACMTENPFIHKNAFSDFITNFIYHDDVAKILVKILDKKGILNIGGKSQSVFDFAKSKKIKTKKILAKKFLGINAKLNVSMNLNKLKKIIK